MTRRCWAKVAMLSVIAVMTVMEHDKLPPDDGREWKYTPQVIRG